MRLTISPSDQVLKQYSNALGHLGERDGHKALARAVNRTTNTVHSRVVRAVAKQSSIPTRIVRDQVKKHTVRPGGMGTLEGIVYARGNPISLKEFRARQFSYGVKAKVWGKQTRFEGMFIFAGTYRSGKHVGNGHVFQRKGGYSSKSGRNNAIEKQFGPAVPTEIVRNEAKDEFERTVQHMLPQRVQHELARLLP